MENKEEEEESQLRRFGQHCQHFYNSSLVLRPSSSSLSSIQEEKKADDKYHVGEDDNDMKKKHADGKIVLEALDRINTIRSIVATPQPELDQPVTNTLQNLRQEHTLMAEQHHSILLECGLLDIDRFTAAHSDGQRDEASSLMQKYIHVRDAMRRRAHNESMLHRQNSLFELLSTASDMHNASSTSTTPTKPYLTQIENIQHTTSLIQKFVNKYQSNIGSHPFLAGLYRIIDLQLNPKSGSQYSNKDPTYVIQWNFRGTVLTEASRSCHGKHHNENEDDELAYAREAIEVLFSFLIWIKDDIDIEGGVQNKLMLPTEEEMNDSAMLEILNQSNNNTKETDEPILSFEIDKHISNRSLQRILSVLPDPKRLDARATGSVKVLECSNGNKSQRKNVDGQEDEPWPWFARFEFCTLL